MTRLICSLPINNKRIFKNIRQILCWLFLGFMVQGWAQEKEASKPDSINKAKPHIVASYSKHGLIKAKKTKKVPVYQYRQANGVMAFSDKPPEKANYQVYLYDCFACSPDSEIDWQSIALYLDKHERVIKRAAKQHSLDPALIRAVIHAESSFDVKALSKTGAMGLMQLMPDTAKEMGVNDAFNPKQNIQGGSRYLAKMLARFNGDIELACAAYNAGATTVNQYQGIPPYPETQAYVKRVKILLKRYRRADSA